MKQNNKKNVYLNFKYLYVCWTKIQHLSEWHSVIIFKEQKKKTEKIYVCIKVNISATHLQIIIYPLTAFCEGVNRNNNHESKFHYSSVYFVYVHIVHRCKKKIKKNIWENSLPLLLIRYFIEHFHLSFRLSCHLIYIVWMKINKSQRFKDSHAQRKFYFVTLLFLFLFCFLLLVFVSFLCMRKDFLQDLLSIYFAFVLFSSSDLLLVRLL